MGKQLPTACIYCGSYDTIRHGYRHNKHGQMQRFNCHKCGKDWTEGGKSARRKLTPIVINLSNKGFSYRNIQSYLIQYHQVMIPTSTLFDWVDRVKPRKVSDDEAYGLMCAP